MLPNIDYADIHGQYKFNFEHAAISRDDSKRFLDWAFRLDFEKNGPSLYRIWQPRSRAGSVIRTTLNRVCVCVSTGKSGN